MKMNSSENRNLLLIKEPRIYTKSTLPNTFSIRLKQPESFIPENWKKHFNEKMFYNILHRECFNSCIDIENSKDCYLNCRDKHSASIEIFKTAVEEKRKWNLLGNIINLREYQKRPQDIGKNVPSDVDYYAKTRYIKDQLNQERELLTSGLDNVFKGASNLFSKEKTNIFKMYVSGLFPPNTKKALERNNIQGRYEEYMKLNEKYGERIDELMNSKDPEFTWGHIDGEDYEAEADTEAEQ
jgi:hypothetical protein